MENSINVHPGCINGLLNMLSEASRKHGKMKDRKKMNDNAEA